MRKLASFRAGICIGVFLVGGCASTADPPAPSLVGALDNAALQQLAQQHRVCGVVVAALREREPQPVLAASACPAQPAPGADSVFEAASLSKPVFAYAVLQLVREGRLALDAPVLPLLPPRALQRFSTPTDPRLGQVTVRMLLNHSTGLPNWSRGALAFSFEPGTRWQYSGEGYLLLQRVVEAVAGAGLDRIVAERVFTPLGMARSSFVWQPAFEAQAMAGHGSDGGVRPLSRFSTPNAASTLYTSAADYARFVAAVLKDAEALRLLTEAPVDTDERLQLRWGLGWGLAEQAGDTLLWQWGNNPGYRAFVLVSPARGDGFVMLTDSEDGLKLAPAIAASLLPGEHRLFGFRMLR